MWMRPSSSREDDSPSLNGIALAGVRPPIAILSI